MNEGINTNEIVPLIENEDYYFDRGLMVFTVHYHLRRGYCCDQGCRHCPYDEALRSNDDRNVDNKDETK
jgi:hypothetical protein